MCCPGWRGGRATPIRGSISPMTYSGDRLGTRSSVFIIRSSSSSARSDSVLAGSAVWVMVVIMALRGRGSNYQKRLRGSKKAVVPGEEGLAAVGGDQENLFQPAAMVHV